MKTKLTKQMIDGLQHAPCMYKAWDTDLRGFFLRVAPRPSNRKTFCVFYRLHGRGRDFTIGQYGALTPEQARKLAKDKLGKVANGFDIQADKKAERDKAKTAKLRTLGGFIKNEYKPWAEIEMRGHREQLRVLDVDFKDMHGTPLHQITPWVVQKWAIEKRKSGLQPSTINRRVAALKSVLAQAVKCDLIEASPLRGMKRIKTDDAAKPRFLSADEETRLRAALDTRQAKQRIARDQHNAWLAARHLEPFPALADTFTDHIAPLALLALNTGMRRGELFNLEWQDVDLAGRLVTIQGAGAKSGRTRHIPLNDDAFAALVAWRNQSGKDATRVFPSPRTGERLDNINTAWARVLKDAGIKAFRFHDLRHTFASNLVMRGVDLTTVRELLGHADMETTLRYAHLAPEHKAAAVALLGSPKPAVTAEASA